MINSTAAPQKLKFFEPPSFDPHQVSLAYHAHCYHDNEYSFVRGHGINAVHLNKGQLHIDDMQVLKPRINHDMITWHQQIDGHFTSGHLAIGQKGTELKGVIYRGTTPEDAVEHHVLALPIQPTRYFTRITQQRQPTGSDPATPSKSDWVKGAELKVGYAQAEGDQLVHTVVFLDGNEVTQFTSWKIDKKTHQLTLTIALDSGSCVFAPTLYKEVVIAFDQLKPVPTFSGVVKNKCDDPTGKGEFLWTGTAQSEIEKSATQSGRASIHPQMMAEISVTDLQAASDPELSLPELMHIIPDAAVSDMANRMLVENMKWAMGQDSDEKDWLNKFMGQRAPDLSAARQKLVKEGTNFYTQKFAKAYLSQSFQTYDGPNAPSTRLDPDQAIRLKQYLQTGLAKDKDFNSQQNGIYLQAFVLAKPRLQAFLNDGGQKWAKQLYDVITSPAQINLMVAAVISANDMSLANQRATLLSVLEPKQDKVPEGDYLAKRFMTLLMSKVLTNLAHQTTWKKGNVDEVMEWLPDWLQGFLTKVSIDDTVPDQAKIIAQQIKALQEEMGGSLTKVAAEMANMMVNATGDIRGQTIGAQAAFAKKFPKFAAAGNVMFVAAWSMGVVFVAKSFQNWGTLKKEDKIRTVAATVQLGMSAIEHAPEILSAVKTWGLKGWNKLSSAFAGKEIQDAIAPINESLSSDWVKLGASQFEADIAAGEAGVAASRWSQFMEAGGSKIFQIVGIAVSAVFAVLSTIDFIHDMNDPDISKQQLALDGVMMAVNIGVTVCLVVDLFVATVIFATAAAVLAVAGLIVVLVLMFTTKPPNPIEDFMKDTAVPFVKGLPKQLAPPASVANSKLKVVPS